MRFGEMRMERDSARRGTAAGTAVGAGRAEGRPGGEGHAIVQLLVRARARALNLKAAASLT